ncbi:hypothetical protein C5749_12595 [Sphingobacterium gobiense]|uniref:Uncharacterized protein n=1 Tax=Sphingobacterium gobiense TaxID=1382456 RepID=A0A2S9JME2_9SPHI|nr:hypothetical protein C5749_12595 [Sphingobacterium gobiense]
MQLFLEKSCSKKRRFAVMWIKLALYCFTAIFMQGIPLKTACCLTGGSFMLFRNSQRKIVKLYSALIFWLLFYQEKRSMNLSKEILQLIF